MGKLGFRGSSSEEARRYKLEGHRVEELFAKAIGGSTSGLPPQGKSDCKDPDGLNYSVKKSAKKWQIFLYGLERLVSDIGFQNLANRGLPLSGLLEAFPKEYIRYLQDKESIKSFLQTLKSDSGTRIDLVRSQFKDGNSYLDSKVRLAIVTRQISESLQDRELKKDFLSKSIFNGGEVQKLAIQDGGMFRVFDSQQVLETLTALTEVTTSGVGGQKTDLSIAGQKVIFRAATNIMEIEVRNDSLVHYRQLRCNVNRKAFVALLLANLPVKETQGAIHFHSIRTRQT